MLSKVTVLEQFAANGYCDCDMSCGDCAYHTAGCGKRGKNLVHRLAKIGAKELLKKHKKKRVFDKTKILTPVTADQAVIGSKGYFSDTLAGLESKFKKKQMNTLVHVRSADITYVFRNCDGIEYILFYPVEEEEC